MFKESKSGDGGGNRSHWPGIIYKEGFQKNNNLVERAAAKAL